MKLLLVHGWGFDRKVWTPLLSELGEPAWLVDLGYTGAIDWPELDEEMVIGIGHSFGVLTLLAKIPQKLAGLVSINGFDDFVLGDPVQRRAVDRMRRDFVRNPGDTLGRFLARCGASSPETFDRHRLAGDLSRLSREIAMPFDRPLLSLQGREDPIFPARLHERAFDRCSKVVRRSLEDEGHVLPLTAPRLCADEIRAFRSAVLASR